MKSLGIIGGGASGMMAAIAAGNLLGNTIEIQIFERKDRPGKKILATGNGRCNITNMKASAESYHGKHSGFVKFPLEYFNPQMTLDFFYGLGLLCKKEYGGRVYPYSDQASAVLDVLRNQLLKLNIPIISDTEVTSVSVSEPAPKGLQNFKISARSNGEVKSFYADKMIISTGGSAAPALGSNGSGFEILSKLNHRIIKPVPALCQIKTENTVTKALQGIKCDGIITAFSYGKEIASSEGEILLTDYGLSGPAVMDVSRVLYEQKQITVTLDLMKEYSPEELFNMLVSRRETLKHLTMEQFFIGMLNKRVGQVFTKLSGIEKLSLPVSQLTDYHIKSLVNTIKKLALPVLGHNGWENAQVTAGGACVTQFDSHTMESKLIEGLYATGEVLDIFGDCGGYNLQWAWSTGYLAGISAAKNFLHAQGE